MSFLGIFVLDFRCSDCIVLPKLTFTHYETYNVNICVRGEEVCPCVSQTESQRIRDFGLNPNQLQKVKEKIYDMKLLYCHRPCLGVGVVLGPEGDELPQVVEPEDGPVPGQVVEVVHDDGNKEVQHEEGADDEKADEVGVGKVCAAPPRVSGIIRLNREE